MAYPMAYPMAYLRVSYIVLNYSTLSYEIPWNPGGGISYTISYIIVYDPISSYIILPCPILSDKTIWNPMAHPMANSMEYLRVSYIMLNYPILSYGILWNV